jgi:hypothetical protein
MVLVDPGATRSAAAEPLAADVDLVRHNGLHGAAAKQAAAAIVEVLVDAFDVGADRRAGVFAETIVSLGQPSFTHYLARSNGRPVAVARRATFDGISYLSSIGTVGTERGRRRRRMV